MMKQFNDFTNLYPVSKTLRFELKPIGKTLDNIKNVDIIKKDNHRADSYQKVKKIIDEYHKVFIDTALNRFGRAEIRQDMTELLRSYYNLYLNGNKTKEEDKKFEKIQTDLRELIVSVLTGAKGKHKDKDQNGRYKNLFKEELIRDILPPFVSSEEDRKLLSEFKGFTTYFVGFHENRKNIYSDQAHSTAISYRLIHENLPKFIDNLLIFEKIKDPLSHELSDLYTTFTDGGYINVPRLNDIFTLEHYTHVLSQKGIESYNAVIGKVVGEDGTEYKGLNERINLYNQRQNRNRRSTTII
ncbi:hypothetical protein QYZ87_00155 [Porphyromonadaceae bacterium W3.11]|nr:hypothetical protein [Porphyromonadaceae bacterium W3.11]